MDDVKSETSCSVNKTDFKTFNGFNVFVLVAKWYCKSSIPLPKYYYLIQNILFFKYIRAD